MKLAQSTILDRLRDRIVRLSLLCKPYLAPCALFALGVLALELANNAHVLAQCGGVSQSCAAPDYDDSLIRNSVGNLFELIEGAFGALIMVVAGLGAIVAAAMGAYRAAVGMLVVAVGAFILRALVSLFFGNEFPGWSDYENF